MKTFHGSRDVAIYSLKLSLTKAVDSLKDLLTHIISGPSIKWR